MKIISLTPSFTEILQAIDRSADLVAVTDHCPEISGAARIGSPKALQLEKIEGLGADLILADRNDNRPEEIARLEKKFHVLAFEVRSIPAVADTVWAIGRALNEVEKAGALKDKILNAAQKNLEETETADGVPALILLWNQPYLTLNFDTYPSRLIETSGGANVFHSEPVREIPVELEDMIEKNPAVCLLATEPFPFRKSHIEKFRQYRVFSKIRIELVDGRFFSRYGPATIEALEYFRALFSSVGAPSRSALHP